jgi:hypothetical protein
LGTVGQLSEPSGMPSPSMSPPPAAMPCTTMIVIVALAVLPRPSLIV